MSDKKPVQGPSTQSASDETTSVSERIESLRKKAEEGGELGHEHLEDVAGGVNVQPGDDFHTDGLQHTDGVTHTDSP